MYNDIRRLMQTLGQATPDRITKDFPRELRAKLIIEEALEFANACGFEVHVQAADTDANGKTKQTFQLSSVDGSLTPPPMTDERMVEAIDAIVDTVVVTLGAAVAMGVEDLVPYWDEVQRSNLAKANGPLRADGKRLKPEGWTPPNLRSIYNSINTYREVYHLASESVAP